MGGCGVARACVRAGVLSASFGYGAFLHSGPGESLAGSCGSRWGTTATGPREGTGGGGGCAQQDATRGVPRAAWGVGPRGDSSTQTRGNTMVEIIC